jgi:hypothetical protein
MDYDIYHHCITKISVTKTMRLTPPKDLHQILLPASLGAAGRAFVLLDAFCLGWSYLHALPMEPLLADVTTNPKLISIVISPTAPTKCFTVLIFILSTKTFKCLRMASHLPIN